MHFVKAKGILSASNGMNLYRGCQHGCIYCDSRSRCYQMDHPFEDIEVKENALLLLDRALRAKRTRCMIGTGSMTDPYIPLEEQLGLTRGALELIHAHGFGLAIQTKSDRILRDLELIAQINEKSKAVVQITLTTHDETLCRLIEPNVATTARRIEVLKAFRDAGVPTIVWLSPILPFINDTPENITGILDACAQAGVRGVLCFGMGLTLREGSREYFYAQLDRKFPGLKQRYIRTFGNSYELLSPKNSELMNLFHEICQRNGILHDNSAIFRYLRTFEDKSNRGQMCFLEQ